MPTLRGIVVDPGSEGVEPRFDRGQLLGPGSRRPLWSRSRGVTTMAEASSRQSGLAYLRMLEGAALIVAILYLAKAVIVPLALAVLLTFILTPIVTAVQRRGLGRVSSVLLVVL